MEGMVLLLLLGRDTVEIGARDQRRNRSIATPPSQSRAPQSSKLQL
jgi:hypothetical protein